MAPGSSASYLVADWLSWTASITKREEFYSDCNRHPGYQFSLLLPKLLSTHSQNTKIPHHGIPHSKRLTSHQIKSVLLLWGYHVLQLPPKWTSEYQARAPAPTLNSQYLWSDSVYLPGYLVSASRLCVTRACPPAGTPSATPCWLSWIPTPCLPGPPPPVAVIILSK